jgi:threonylcarbamoyladenosine tRNA methylthiotransferase MtaB
MSLRVAFHTLGCKLNQLETESFAEAFARAGAEVLSFDADEAVPAELVIVNTCTVTSKAEQKARRIVRLALAADPEAVVLITGCYAEVEAESLSSLGGRALVLKGALKAELLGLPSFLAESGLVQAGKAPCGPPLFEALGAWLSGVQATAREPKAAGVDGRFAYNPEAFSFHSRPSLKIEDGCDNACAYCRVHIARGAAVSLPASEVLSRARALEAAGKAEIVLAGVNLAQYRDGDTDFPGLLKLLVAGTESIAFRVSSYEPDLVNSGFIEAFSQERVRPHVHLALQSGSDSVLSAMNRHYGREEVFASVEALKRVRRDPFLAADIIAGFPGESAADAEATLDLARECGFAWIHAFRFSPRPGTKAAAMPNRVPERVAQERVDALLELGRSGRDAYIARWLGVEVGAVLESDLCATSENYLKLKVDNSPATIRSGQAIRCRIERNAIVADDKEIDARALYIS